jgi:hypothetical protein
MEVSMKRRQMLLSTVALSHTMLSSLLSDQQRAHLAGLKCTAETCELCQRLDNNIQAHTVEKSEHPVVNKLDSHSSQT